MWSTSSKEGSSATKNGDGGENHQPEKAASDLDGGEGGGGGGGKKSSSVASSSSAASSFASNAAAAVASSPRATATAVGAMTTAVTNKAKTVVKEVQDAVIETIEETNDFESEDMVYHSDEEYEVQLGGRRTSISDPSYRSRNKKVKFHVQSYLIDHHSLLVPSSMVRFRPGSSPSTGGQRMSVIANAATETAAANAVTAMKHNNIGTIDEEKENDEEEQSPALVVGRTFNATAPPPPLTGGTSSGSGVSADKNNTPTFHTASRVIEDSSTQIILEERYDQATLERTVIVKRVNTG